MHYCSDIDWSFSIFAWALGKAESLNSNFSWHPMKQVQVIDQAESDSKWNFITAWHCRATNLSNCSIPAGAEFWKEELIVKRTFPDSIGISESCFGVKIFKLLFELFRAFLLLQNAITCLDTRWALNNQVDVKNKIKSLGGNNEQESLWQTPYEALLSLELLYKGARFFLGKLLGSFRWGVFFKYGPFPASFWIYFSFILEHCLIIIAKFYNGKLW